MKAIKLPNQNYLNTLFKYNAEHGSLHWLPQPGRKCNHTQSRAGCISSRGYRVIRIDGKLYKEHRIIWVMHNGLLPDGFDIDHIDRNRSNNKLENLRVVTRSENNLNKDVKGVTYDKSRNKWKAQLSFKGSKILNKRFDSYEEALDVYNKTKLQLN